MRTAPCNVTATQDANSVMYFIKGTQMAAWGWLVLIEEPHHRLIQVDTHQHRTVMLDQSILGLLWRSSSCETWVHTVKDSCMKEVTGTRIGCLLTRKLLFNIAI